MIKVEQKPRKFSLNNPKITKKDLEFKNNGDKHLRLETNSLFFKTSSHNIYNAVNHPTLTEPKYTEINKDDYPSENLFNEINRKYRKVIAMNKEFKYNSSTSNKEKKSIDKYLMILKRYR